MSSKDASRNRATEPKCVTSAVFAIVLTAWPPYARLARAETLTVRNTDYIAAVRLTGASSFTVGSIPLGNIYSGSGIADEDLVLHYRTTGGALVKSITTYVGAASLPGDYNDDGDVDGDDLTVWKNSFGQTGASLPADGNNSGAVDGSDFLLWQRQFGQSSSATDAAVGVPEPASIVAAVSLVLPIIVRRRRGVPSRASR